MLGGAVKSGPPAFNSPFPGVGMDRFEPLDDMSTPDRYNPAVPPKWHSRQALDSPRMKSCRCSAAAGWARSIAHAIRNESRGGEQGTAGFVRGRSGTPRAFQP